MKFFCGFFDVYISEKKFRRNFFSHPIWWKKSRFSRFFKRPWDISNHHCSSLFLLALLFPLTGKLLGDVHHWKFFTTFLRFYSPPPVVIFGVVPENNFIEGWARRRFVENCSNRHKFLHQEHDPLRENRFNDFSKKPKPRAIFAPPPTWIVLKQGRYNVASNSEK